MSTFSVTRGFNVRAGMLLMPVGIINERHEPPVYYGVERPFVDTVIVPTTWFEVGAGVHGELGRGLRYRAYVTSPLDAARVQRRRGRAGGTAEGRGDQHRPTGGDGTPRVRRACAGSRLAPASGSGRSGFQFRPRFDVPVTVGEADARYSRDRLELRAQFAQVAHQQRRANSTTRSRARSASIRMSREPCAGSTAKPDTASCPAPHAATSASFVRYENFDTQFRMPAGYVPLKEFDRDAWVVGATYWPDPDIAVKVDYAIMRNQSAVIKAPNSFNVGLGWWF